MRRHEIDRMQRCVAKTEEMPQFMRRSLFVFKGRAVWGGPGYLGPFWASKRERPSLDGGSVHLLNRRYKVKLPRDRRTRRVCEPEDNPAFGKPPLRSVELILHRLIRPGGVDRDVNGNTWC